MDRRNRRHYQMRTSKEARKPRHAKGFDSGAESAVVTMEMVEVRIEAIEADRKVKTGRRLKFVKPALQRNSGSFKEDASSGCRQRVSEACDFGIVQRLATSDPKYGRPTP